MEHRTAAHGAGLQRDVQLAAVQPVIAQGLRGGAQRSDFRVGGGIVAAHRGVSPDADHLPVANDHGPDGHFAGGRGQTGLFQCQLHEPGIADFNAII